MYDLTPQSPRDLLTLMASTSTQIDVFSDGVIQSVKEGEINPLTVLIQLKAMEQAANRILKEIKDNLLTEAGKYPEREFEYLGNKIAKAEHGTKYDYSKCGDPVYQRLFEAAFEANGKLKERENFLKSIKEPFNFVDDVTGEVCFISPPTKKSTSGLNVSIR